MVGSKGLATRKPRPRAAAKLYGIEKAKARYLKRLADIGTVSETLEKLDIPWGRLAYWLDSDPEFCRKCDEITRKLQAANREKVRAIVAPSLALYTKTVEKALREVESSKRVRSPILKEGLHVADKVLGSEGIIQEPVKKEEIKGVIGLFNADDIAREFREARKRILEAGGRPVGVPDHPG